MTSNKPRITFLLLLMIVLMSFAVGCTHVEPWQRSKLAYPTMTLDPVSGAQEHVYSVQEGAVGGGAGVSSGCGCN
jgi:hypothetical protein